MANVVAIIIIVNVLLILNNTRATGNSEFCNFAAISLHFFCPFSVFVDDSYEL